MFYCVTNLDVVLNIKKNKSVVDRLHNRVTKLKIYIIKSLEYLEIMVVEEAVLSFHERCCKIYDILLFNDKINVQRSFKIN